MRLNGFSTKPQPADNHTLRRGAHTRLVTTRRLARWAGTRPERQTLVAVIRRHCTCTRDQDGLIRRECAAHQMLVYDQRALDGLLFARRLADRWRGEEWT